MDPIAVITTIGQIVDAISSLYAVWSFVNLTVKEVAKRKPQAANYFACLVEPNGTIDRVKDAIAEHTRLLSASTHPTEIHEMVLGRWLKASKIPT
ncbi:hypothetical protein F5Y03DRAFT_389976 [Xylaria venustula]|nr:hypothetical protein F5Y03DRAFT_389976 [Xylaria venustula]